MTVQFDAAIRAPAELLAERVLVTMLAPHNHAGIAGVEEGSGCIRCNAEKALAELVRRSKRHA
jgi:hypothetical protein